MTNPPLSAQIEALLFVSAEPTSVSTLARATNTSTADIQDALHLLTKQLADRGIRLSRHNERYYLTTAPEAAPTIEQFLIRPPKDDLSPAALETLAAIAYRGALTVRQVSELRGVASDTTMRSLQGRGLIEPAGQSDQPGNAPLYRTSAAFLEHFGLTSIDDLPKPRTVTETAA